MSKFLNTQELLEDAYNDFSFFKYKVELFLDGKYWSEIKSVNFGAGEKAHERAKEFYNEIIDTYDKYEYLKGFQYIKVDNNDEMIYTTLTIRFCNEHLINGAYYIILEEVFKLKNQIIESILEKKGEIK